MNITRKKEFVLLENRLILPGKTNQVRGSRLRKSCRKRPGAEGGSARIRQETQTDSKGLRQPGRSPGLFSPRFSCAACVVSEFEDGTSMELSCMRTCPITFRSASSSSSSPDRAASLSPRKICASSVAQNTCVSAPVRSSAEAAREVMMTGSPIKHTGMQPGSTTSAEAAG